MDGGPEAVQVPRVPNRDSIHARHTQQKIARVSVVSSLSRRAILHDERTRSTRRSIEDRNAREGCERGRAPRASSSSNTRELRRCGGGLRPRRGVPSGCGAAMPARPPPSQTWRVPRQTCHDTGAGVSHALRPPTLADAPLPTLDAPMSPLPARAAAARPRDHARVGSA